MPDTHVCRERDIWACGSDAGALTPTGWHVCAAVRFSAEWVLNHLPLQAVPAHWQAINVEGNTVAGRLDRFCPSGNKMNFFHQTVG